jgi:hypothetical protein
MHLALASEKAVISVKNPALFPGVREDTLLPKPSSSYLTFRGMKQHSLSTQLSFAQSSQRVVDLWWFLHDGGMLVLMAWLMSQHRVWRGCTIRVFVAVEGEKNYTRLECKFDIFFTRFECKFDIFITRFECIFDIFFTRFECIFDIFFTRFECNF